MKLFLVAALSWLAAGEYPYRTVADMVAPASGGTVAVPTTFSQGLTAQGNVLIQNANVIGTATFAQGITAQGNVVMQNANIMSNAVVTGGTMTAGVPGSQQGYFKMGYGAVVGQGVILSGTGTGMYVWDWNNNYIAVFAKKYADQLGNGLDLSNLNTSTLLRSGGGTTALTLDSNQNTTLAGTLKVQNAGTVRSGSATPNSAVVGNVGDIYICTAGGSATTLWVKESGAGTNTGWVGK